MENGMLKECKRTLDIEQDETAYDEELADLIEAAAAFLTETGIQIKGAIKFTRVSGTVTDQCTVTDASTVMAIKTYVKTYFKNPPNYDKLLEALNSQISRLKKTSGHTVWGEGID